MEALNISRRQAVQWVVCLLAFAFLTRLCIGMLYYKEQNMIYNALPRTLQPGYNFGPHCHKNVEVCMRT